MNMSLKYKGKHTKYSCTDYNRVEKMKEGECLFKGLSILLFIGQKVQRVKLDLSA